MKKKSKTDKSQLDIEDLKNQLARALADYDNLRKRTEKEKELIGKIANARLLERLLPVLDMMEEVQGHLEDPGLAIVVSEFRKSLEREGLYEIKVKVGDRFDENKHEAIDTIKGRNEKEAGTVAEIINSGWEIDDLMIRPVKVKVYS